MCEESFEKNYNGSLELVNPSIVKIKGFLGLKDH